MEKSSHKLWIDLSFFLSFFQDRQEVRLESLCNATNKKVSGNGEREREIEYKRELVKSMQVWVCIICLFRGHTSLIWIVGRIQHIAQEV
jgi:hypothetical protein